MTDIRKVKIETILESQIPGFLASDSPLFKEFLTQYYISQTHSTGTLDFANNLTDYKNISTYASEKLYTTYEGNECNLSRDVLTFDDEIIVNSTIGFPDKYGLLQIDNEIITYTSITANSFTGCIRGFSGVSDISDVEDITGLIFSSTLAEEHLITSNSKVIVKNLNTIFYKKIFEKFKSQYLPDFENREFSSKVDLDLILSRAKDFYLTKGTDISYKILFEVLYNDAIEILKPQEYLIRSSNNQYLVTRNILVELVLGDFKPQDIIGRSIYQQLPNGATASAAIYNVEYRPTDEYNLYEISLDSESFIYDFIPTKKTVVLERASNDFIVDSTVGFADEGILYIRSKEINETYSINSFQYLGKSINKFLNISGINTTSYVGSEIIENNLLEVILDDASLVQFRLINVINYFDFSDTNTININDKIYLSYFGENFSDKKEFSSWIYNYPTYHNIKSIDSSGFITLKDSIKFIINEEIELLDGNNNALTTKVKNIISSNIIEVDSNVLSIGNPKVKVKKKITKSSLDITECANIQNTYLNEYTDSLVVVSSGLPNYKTETKLNNYTFNIVGIGTLFKSTLGIDNTSYIKHNLLSGNRIYIQSNNIELTTGEYYIKKIDDVTLSLFKSTGDLYLSFASDLNLSSNSNAISINSTFVGIATIFGYQNSVNGFSNQLLLKEFNISRSYYMNNASSSNQIYTIEDAYNAFK